MMTTLLGRKLARENEPEHFLQDWDSFLVGSDGCELEQASYARPWTWPNLPKSDSPQQRPKRRMTPMEVAIEGIENAAHLVLYIPRAGGSLPS